MLFVPTTCQNHKIEHMKRDGKEFIEIIQEGHDFD